ncbi:chemotaxis protein CheB [Lysobacter sp. A03]|uniref:chemotaxis protein CheB n=1 Tax=Lysobacter sp. A03 TaxID=1199154 RepID=UPI0005B744DA|nr:chemotaxis protein CheB [Lysobacter sp. A03]KIQ97908.1 glutamate methyltransferase [Lysobacter sp. A03]
MSSNPLKVALLAQAGSARDRLREVIDAAGAQCVLESDPQEISPADVSTSEAKVVLVALDPQTEDAMEAFDEVLADPDLEVVYEEASLAAAREGWDMARWQRHLVAKIQSHGNVLPPGTEQEAPEPGQGVNLDTISGGPGGAPELEPQVDSASLAETINPFDPVFAETAAQESGHVPAFEPGDVADGLDLSLTLDPMVDNDEAGAAEASLDRVSAQQPAFDTAMDETGQPAAPGIDAEASTGPQSSSSAMASDEDGEAAGRFGVLTLDDGSTPLASGGSAESDDRLARDIVELEERISGLTLVDDSPRKEPEHARGAVLVLAGLGGPDAVRQLVAAMPAGFPRPVLIQQRLDGGRHDRLVAQMQRATELPVRLAEADQYAMAGTVYILAEDLGIDVSDAGIRFRTGSELVASLPSSDSAVLLLSGTDPSVVDATLRLGWAGALVAGQSADGCYDATASAALASRGGDTATPAELAQRLGERWPA